MSDRESWDQGPLYPRPGALDQAPTPARSLPMQLPPAAELEAAGQRRLPLGAGAYGARCQICGGGHLQRECPRAARMFGQDPAPRRRRAGRSARRSAPGAPGSTIDPEGQ